MIPRAPSIFLVLTMLLVVSGCTTQPGSTATHQSDTSSDLPAGPFNGLTNQSSTEVARLQVANSILISKCMRRRSFTYHAVRPPMPVDEAATRSAYDLLSVSTASKQGYGIADNAFISQADASIGSSSQSTSTRPEYIRALTGTAGHKVTIRLIGGSKVSFDANGCVTVAINELYGHKWNRVYFDVDALAIRIVQQVEASSPWRKSVSKWAHCMRINYNVAFASPRAARAQVENTVSSAIENIPQRTAARRLKAVRMAEVRLARQDATCEARVGLAAVAQAAQRRAQVSVERRYSMEMHVYATEFAHAVRIANALLGRSGA